MVDADDVARKKKNIRFFASTKSLGVDNLGKSMLFSMKISFC